MPPTIRRRVIRAAAQPPMVPLPERRGVAASAQRIPLVKRDGVSAKRVWRREWQEEAWAYFDDVPEVKYSTAFMGNVMAKLRLFPAVLDPNDPDAPPVPASDADAGLGAGVASRAQAELDRLAGPLGGRGEILRALNMNLEISGEGYIIGFGPREVDVKDPLTEEIIGTEIIPEDWGVYSVSQFIEKDGKYSVKMRPDDSKSVRALDPAVDAEPIRVYQRHARWSLEADCAMRGVLSACEALVLLDNSIKAEAKSRMSGGYLLIPNELSGGPDVETEPEDGEEAPVDPFLQEIYDGAVDPVEDPSSAASVAPTFVRGPADALKEFRHVTIARTSDATVLPKITALIERIARGMNLPVEVVMGHQQTTFANAMQVKQDTFDEHFQPRCVLICDALTVGFLRPNLIAAGMDEAIVERLVVWFDASLLIKQVNPVDSADQGIALDLISGEAWRRAWGWSEDDAPDPIERLVRAVMHLRTFDPGVSTAILELLGVPLDIPQALPNAGGDTGPPGPNTQAAIPPPAAPMPVAASNVALERLVAERIAARYDLDEPRHTLDMILADLLHRDPDLIRAAAAGAQKTAARNVGRELMLLDRELRTKLIVAATDAMSRALERAGNVLRASKGQASTLARAGFVHPVYVAATLGPKLVAAAGFGDADLVSGVVWNGLEAQWRAWVSDTQARALDIIGQVVTITPAHRQTLAARQAADLDDAWSWFRDQLHTLAAYRLYHPDPAQPPVGEFDPTARVPAGLVRQAIARAGGATGIQPLERRKQELRAAGMGADAEGAPVYVAVDNGEPLGGIGTGDVVLGGLTDAGGGIDGYEWTYGPAMRLHPFEPHLELDGEQFVNFDDDVLAAGDWIGDFYFPGDHDGCNCDVTPTVIDNADGTAQDDTSDLTASEDVSAPPTPEERIAAATTKSDAAANDPRGSTTIDLDGLPEENRAVLADRIEAFARDFPDAAQALTRVSVEVPEKKLRETFAFVRHGGPIPRHMSELHLNATWVNNPVLLRETLLLNAEKTYGLDGTLALGREPGVVGWLARGDGIGGVIDHELGHVLDNYYQLSERMTWADPLFDTKTKLAMPNGPAGAKTWMSPEAQRELMQISMYAQYNAKEMLAELFSLRQQGGIAEIEARSQELARMFRDGFDARNLIASADKKTPPVEETDVHPPMIAPHVKEALKAKGLWPFPEDDAR